MVNTPEVVTANVAVGKDTEVAAPTLEQAYDFLLLKVGYNFPWGIPGNEVGIAILRAKYDEVVQFSSSAETPLSLALALMKWSARIWGALQPEVSNMIAQLTNLAATRLSQKKQENQSIMVRTLANDIDAWYRLVQERVAQIEETERARRKEAKQVITTAFIFNGYIYCLDTTQQIAIGTIIKTPANQSRISIFSTRPETKPITKTVYVRVTGSRINILGLINDRIDAQVEVEEVTEPEDTENLPMAKLLN